MNYFYLIKIQYLGFRYHGWQKQPQLKTVHLMIDKTLNYVFGGEKKFKSLAVGRTDAMVSANETAFELFVEEPILNFDIFIECFNYYLPQDIRALSMKAVDKDFNVIQNAKLKEYVYVFAHGQKAHPFCAAIMTTFRDVLDIEIMIQGAKLFEGIHNFKGYCSKVSENGLYVREVVSCQLIPNTTITASFFPKESFLLRVKGEGFGYNQIRTMMGTLVKLGQHEISLSEIADSLKFKSSVTMDYIAPASGLILNAVEFE
ncbi:tRNA pseudouridine(38-40) synthase TruA [Gelidibacter salicanalis]|uniref:tRNA pseudouridine synthase A n=1 Tax=Gelidibacter salicanalis TaxID=291193 RepID=A0A934NEM9_9FLAO|nr:tRNA pseudouridine(38-40) synthase TruA [Gelidibacter salicanalis]MBJ7882870.1 tRNA pseudouridine(38-40) synthase TruA [Gelidibacter salicanalis]